MSNIKRGHSNNSFSVLIRFPKHFLWGSATSSHQVEGDNSLNDWWAWEQTQPITHRSGKACDSWHRWQEDLQLLQELGQNAYRFSFEWSRIEPKEGMFDQVAIAHYRTILEACRARGITSIVTFHHFTNPNWLAEKGGWREASAVEAFAEYAERCLHELGELIDILITINEPQVYAFMSYQIGAWPPQHHSIPESLAVMWNMARAHRKVYTVSKRLQPSLPVGIACNMTSFVAQDATWFTGVYARVASVFNNRSFYWLTGYDAHDFFGVNYYFHRRLKRKYFVVPHVIDPKELKLPVSDLGWELFPEGVVNVIDALTSKNKPIFITEHGLADAEDSRRPEYLERSIQALMAAKQRGIPLAGYVHWSLMDNFEWADGFTPRFGLVEIDYSTQKRIPRSSAHLYRRLIQRFSSRIKNS